MGTISIDDLFKQAEKLGADKDAAIKGIAAVRDTLRSLRDSGMLSADEKARLAKLFPVRVPGGAAAQTQKDA